MKRVAVSMLLVVAFVGCRKATPKTDAPPGQATQASGDPWKKEAAPPATGNYLPRPLFWSIEKDGKTSYALGTIHVGVDAKKKLPPAVWSKLEAAPTFAMETDLSDPVIMKSLQCVGCSLRRDLGEEDYAKLEKVLDANVAKMVDGMKPMVAATMVAMKGLPQTGQMDTALLERAKEKQAQLVYLEPASHQAAMLEKHMDIKALKVMLADPDGTVDQTKQLLAAYLEGDDAKMVALNAEFKKVSLANGVTEKEYDESQEDMLYKRNESWIAPIEQLHAAGGGFIAVGALHLVGPRNVLELLAKKGYKITRM